MTLFSFAKNTLSTTDPAFVTSAFAPFASTVSTTYDANYFYVNSTGIPNHTMMVGISNHGWQQQVPISKCYINTNHWTIPLNPVLAATPVPVSATHFTKGAIAMAANGVPIFNYHTNTGVDSFLDGQLDNYGGHCGRGDDYHYHTAPLHLITLGQTTYNLPIAFGLDGYAVYGTLEPTGDPMATLDANHGHYFNGVYHYHGTATAPYMIGNMVGQVTEDATLQIIPQPQGNPVRTENWTPLNGALITSCVANANNGYSNNSWCLYFSIHYTNRNNNHQLQWYCTMCCSQFKCRKFYFN
jgi:YHYH protein